MQYILTGCSSGLGFEIVKKLLDNKCSVIGLSRKLGKSGVMVDDPNFKHVTCDFGSRESIHKLDNFITGAPTVLIINAAQFLYEGDALTNVEKSREIFDVNYFSACALVEKLMSNGLVRVMFINSVAGVSAQSGQAQYSASKHALQAYSEVLAKVSVGREFDVMSINPGGLDTELWDDESLLDKSVTDNFIKPDCLAELIWSLLSLPPKTYVKSAVILPEHDV